MDRELTFAVRECWQDKNNGTLDFLSKIQTGREKGSNADMPDGSFHRNTRNHDYQAGPGRCSVVVPGLPSGSQYASSGGSSISNGT